MAQMTHVDKFPMKITNIVQRLAQYSSKTSRHRCMSDTISQYMSMATTKYVLFDIVKKTCFSKKILPLPLLLLFI